MATPCAHEADISLLNTAIVEIKDTLKDLKELLLSNAVLSEQVSHFKETITSIDIRLRKLDVQQLLRPAGGIVVRGLQHEPHHVKFRMHQILRAVHGGENVR